MLTLNLETEKTKHCSRWGLWINLTLPGSSPNANDTIAATEKHHSRYLHVASAR